MKNCVYNCTVTIIVILILILTSSLYAFDKKEVVTEQGFHLLTVEAITKPIRVGRNTFKMMIADRKTGKPVGEKLAIEVIPWMPKHEHGVAEIPVIKELAKGVYIIEGVNFSMPGDWEVYIKIKKNGKEDTGVFDVKVAK